MTIEKYEVTNHWTGAVQFTAEIAVTPDMTPNMKLGLAVQWGRENHANLHGAKLGNADLIGAKLGNADLRGADLRDADLGNAYLSGAYLSGANLHGADLRGADLTGANLADADLTGANLARANLARANLAGANLADADLTGANLARANLARADLRGANLSGANLTGAYLGGAYLGDANLADAKGVELFIARTRILPEGALIGWKKCWEGVIVKLRIPEEAKRSHAFGRKCRAEYADVLEVIGAEVGISEHDGKTEYRAGERVTCDVWSDDWQRECAGGIHFYITRTEAEAHQ